MPSKSFRVEFYQGYVQSDDKKRRVSQIMREVMEGSIPVHTFGEHNYRLRNPKILAAGKSFQGVFAKYRLEVLPHVGAPAGAEREIALRRDEALIEKNHFVYYTQHQLLVYQSNFHASSAAWFARYLTNVVNKAVIFNPVLQQDTLERLVAGNARPRWIEVSYAAPSDAVVKSARRAFSGGLINLLKQSGGVRAHVKVTPERKGYLDLNLSEVIPRLRDDVNLTTARVRVQQENGIEHTVDLVADRFLGQVDVKMKGAYPIAGEMFKALRACYDEHRTTIQQLVNDPGDA
jgi:hypothetical protein